MLRRNVNVKSGLVNGAIGTVVAISPTCIAVKFDQLTDTRDIEQVRGKFIVMKNLRQDITKASKRVAKNPFFGKFYLMWSKECVKTTIML